MRSGVVAEVVESKSSKMQVGDVVMDYHLGYWSDTCILSDRTAQRLDPLPKDLPLTHYLGAFGAAGLAAYTGLIYAGGARRDDPNQTIVVSAAAGATGSMAIQIAAKILRAGRVVGIAGSEEKCAWVKKIGAHECVNYNSPTFAEDLKHATPAEVDLFFDNVGGTILDAMLPRMKRMGKGTIAVCGAIQQYNAAGKPMELHNWCEVFSARITIKGFIMLDYLEHVPAGLQELTTATTDGRLDLSEAETIVEARLEDQPEVWTRLYAGKNTGKLITKLIA
jgi:NADPH-dependent curcumin reductase CurA